MADLLTHISIAHLCKRASPWPRHALLFALGTSLPDLLGRAPSVLLTFLESRFGLEAPPYIPLGIDALHTPIPFAIACLFICYWVPEAHRRVLFRNLVIGGYLHLLVDFPQAHIAGGYRLLFPFSWYPIELKWIGTESSLLIAPYLGLVALGAELLYQWKRRRSAGQTRRIDEGGEETTHSRSP